MNKAILIVLIMVLHNNVAAWEISRNKSCGQITLELALPSADVTCDLDDSSGNPSKWFNPFETCSMDFDMIGLPSISDIKAGISGAICDAISDVKENTIDDLIDEVNEAIPDTIGDDIDETVDLNDDYDIDLEEQDPDGDGICTVYVDGVGNMNYPCVIMDESLAEPNQCYLVDSNDLNNYEKTLCDRYGLESEMCITKWVWDQENDENVPTLVNCEDSGLNPESSSTACYNGSDIVDCSTLDYVTMDDRVCQNSEGNKETCYEVYEDTQCYGYKDNVFQALNCSEFAEIQEAAQATTEADPYSGYAW